MSPKDEAQFITLWNQGLNTAQIAERLGIPTGTVSSRASALQRQGRIQKRPRGVARPHARSRIPGPPSTVDPGLSPDELQHHINQALLIQLSRRLEVMERRLAVFNKEFLSPLPSDLLKKIRAKARRRGIDPTKWVEEVLRAALSNRRSSTS